MKQKNTGLSMRFINQRIRGGNKKQKDRIDLDAVFLLFVSGIYLYELLACWLVSRLGVKGFLFFHPLDITRNKRYYKNVPLN